MQLLCYCSVFPIGMWLYFHKNPPSLQLTGNNQRFLQLIFKWVLFFHFPKLNKLYNLHLVLEAWRKLASVVITNFLPSWWLSLGRSSYHVCLGSAHHFTGIWCTKLKSCNSHTLKNADSFKNTVICHLFGKHVFVGLIFKCKNIISAIAQSATSMYTYKAKLLLMSSNATLHNSPKN